MAGAQPTMLTEASNAADYRGVVNRLQCEVFELKAHMAAQVIHTPPSTGGEKEMTRWRSISNLPKFNGDDKHFKDFEFKLHQFVRPVMGFEKFLDWVKDSDKEPTEDDLTEYGVSTGMPIEYFNDQVYGILSVVAEGDPFQTLMNVSEMHPTRGAQAWYRMTREASGKTGARLKRLSGKVHRPKKITDYKDALAQLTAWDTSLKELIKVEGQGLSELTKITTLSYMVPEDLMRDIDRDKNL